MAKSGLEALCLDLVGSVDIVLFQNQPLRSSLVSEKAEEVFIFQQKQCGLSVEAAVGLLCVLSCERHFCAI